MPTSSMSSSPRALFSSATLRLTLIFLIRRYACFSVLGFGISLCLADEKIKEKCIFYHCFLSRMRVLGRLCLV